MQTPAEEKFLNSKEEILNMVVMALGGRAAEELVFNSVTLVHQMILSRQLPMSEI